ncbi:cell division suppressor protein YneA [Anaerosalibacter massiliensis]|uniref:LysM peptidoglycan-binding domain-containing protein n=1 Tax=Anaerosalibacter massiliensis TaxID=1347392 RepID=A0A9X2MGL0_9FIRM|nr:LysM peptidoglycan-binding domain-containing protein [Anaerosalibacter massiliensis]MCR2042700.1 LysM peptidoglycan-binding domain-containing protein [Anaerosalibacter massiliensis]
MLNKKVSIVNFKRFFLSILVMVIMVILITVIFLNNKAYSITYEEKYHRVKVKEGDTIWGIALKNKPKDYDTRKMVCDIVEFNNLKEMNIYPGDIIKVPIKNQR